MRRFWLTGRKSLLFWILAFAFLARAGAGLVLTYHLSQIPDRRFLIEGDAAGYWELGARIAAGEEYAVYQPPRRVLRMPGFPLLLAASIRVAGENFYFARLLLAAVGTLACGLVYWLGRELFDSRVGLAAAALTAVSPAMIVFSVLVLSETLFAAALVASLIVLAKLVKTGFSADDRKRGAWLALFAGVAIAVATYVRPTWLLVGPLFAVAYLIWSADRKRAFVRCLLLFVGMAVTLVPWTIRNYRATGHLVVTTLWVGPSLYDSLSPEATGESDMSFFDRENVLERMTEYEMDRHYRARAVEFVREHPRRAIELVFIKLWRFLKPWPNAEQFGRWWQQLAIAAFYLPVVLLAVWGWWVFRREPWAWLLTLGPLLYLAAIHMVFVGSLRYRLPAEYPLCVLAAAGGTLLRARWSMSENRGIQNPESRIQK